MEAGKWERRWILDDELLAGFFQSVHILTLQGPVVSSPVAFFALLSSLPFHPPV
jgi:hypothetical protein